MRYHRRVAVRRSPKMFAMEIEDLANRGSDIGDLAIEIAHMAQNDFEVALEIVSHLPETLFYQRVEENVNTIFEEDVRKEARRKLESLPKRGSRMRHRSYRRPRRGTMGGAWSEAAVFSRLIDDLTRISRTLSRKSDVIDMDPDRLENIRDFRKAIEDNIYGVKAELDL